MLNSKKVKKENMHMNKWTKKVVATVTVFSMALGLGAVGGQATTSQAAGVKINETNFPEKAVLDYVKEQDRNQDGVLSSSEAKEKYVYLSTDMPVKDVTSLTKYFKNIVYLYLGTGKNSTLTVGSTKIKTIYMYGEKPVSLKKAAPTAVYFNYSGKKSSISFAKAKGYSKVKTFAISDNSKLKKVTPANEGKLQTYTLSNTAMTKFNASKLKKVKTLNVSWGKLKSLNVKKNKKLTSLSCYSNKLTSLNLSANSALKDIGAGNNQLKKLDVSKNKKLTSVVAYENKLKKVTFAPKAKIKRISLSYNKLTSINLKPFTNLTEVNLGENKIKKIDVTKNKKLRDLSIWNTKVKSLNVTKNKKLATLDIQKTGIKSINLKNNAKLVRLQVADTGIKKLKLAKSAKLSYVNVGDKAGLLKNIKLKYVQYYKGGSYNASVSVKLKKGKYDLKKLVPAASVKGFKFSTYSEGIADCTESGVITLKSTNYTEVYAINGKKTLFFQINV